MMTTPLDFVAQLDLLARLAGALVLGGIIGWERELQHQPAGFRTHALVGLGSALFTVVSIFAFTGPVVDPSRIAAQIVSGIGFLGAGAILKLDQEREIQGLTTAAGIWMTAAIGVAVGLGSLGVALLSTVFTLVILALAGLLDSDQQTKDK